MDREGESFDYSTQKKYIGPSLMAKEHLNFLPEPAAVVLFQDDVQGITLAGRQGVPAPIRYGTTTGGTYVVNRDGVGTGIAVDKMCAVGVARSNCSHVLIFWRKPANRGR